MQIERPSGSQDNPPSTSHDRSLSAVQKKRDPVERAVRVVRFISEINWNPKKFMSAFFSSQAEEIKKRRRLWASECGWKSTKGILSSIKSLTKEAGHIQLWNSWILEEVCSFLILA